MTLKLFHNLLYFTPHAVSKKVPEITQNLLDDRQRPRDYRDDSPLLAVIFHLTPRLI